MKSFLVTPSLIDKIEWYHNCPPNWQVKAYADLKGMLSRTSKWEPTPEIQRGLDYEKELNTLIIRGKKEKPGDSVGTQILQFIGEVELQAEAKKIIEHKGIRYCVYGKIDAKESGIKKLWDFKTTASYKEGKYLNTSQHILYLFCEEWLNFEYLIAEFEKVEQGQPLPMLPVKGRREVFNGGSSVMIEQAALEYIEKVEEFFKEYDELGELWRNVYTKF